MKPWLFAAVVAIVAIAGAMFFIVERNAQHQRELSDARSSYDRLDQQRQQIMAIARRQETDHEKIDASRGAASKAGQERHDLSDSAGAEEYYDLARQERTNVESIEAAESDLATQDEALAEVFEGLYGPQSVAGLRRDMASLNQARQNASAMWWRAAQNVEDDEKEAVNGGSADSISNDEIAQEYAQSTRDSDTSDGLERIVDSGVAILEKRFVADLKTSKAKLVALGH
jgi:hypothetical protein